MDVFIVGIFVVTGWIFLIWYILGIRKGSKKEDVSQSPTPTPILPPVHRPAPVHRGNTDKAFIRYVLNRAHNCTMGTEDLALYMPDLLDFFNVTLDMK